MRRKSFWIAASCVLAMAGLLPAFSSGASPASKEKVVYSFTGGPDGGNPLSDLTLDAEGNLFGTTSRGGAGTACGSSGCGTVFELKRTKDGWKELVLYSFAGGSDGAIPQAGLIFDNFGNLYGTAAFGGYGDGTVFKLTPNSHGWTESTIYRFDASGSAGTYPAADLVFDSHGNLYGTTPEGGTGGCDDNGCGALFELTPQSDGSWTETTVHVFTDNGGDGGTPSSGVVLDSAGNVYGTTKSGGTGSCRLGNYTEGITIGCGTLYRVTKGSGGTWTETVLYNFIRGGGFGIYPSGDLFFNSANHLLGVTLAGGDGFGTVFDLQDTKKHGWRQSTPHIFYGKRDGVRPRGRLVVDASGDLFGVTSRGGDGTNNENGTLFEVKRSKNGWKERIVHSFAGSPDGANPSAGLVSDSQGHLYGTTQTGGSGTGCNQSGCGTVYEVTP
jgi:hypothetical protein